MTIDGRPYAPERLSQIIEERYEISKRINTSYNEIGEITPTEREYLMQLIKRDIEHDNKVTKQILDSRN